jgi:hypothetical protein
MTTEANTVPVSANARVGGKIIFISTNMSKQLEKKVLFVRYSKLNFKRHTRENTEHLNSWESWLLLKLIEDLFDGAFNSSDYKALRLRHSSSGWSLASHSDGPGSSPGLFEWDLWWTKWCWGRFSPSTSVFPANIHPTKFSILRTGPH